MNLYNPKERVAKKRKRNLLAKHLRESKQYKEKTIVQTYNRQLFKKDIKYDQQV